MDDPRPPAPGATPPLQGPHWPHAPEPATPVRPMRLVLFPGGQTVELTRPEVVVGRHSQADLCLRMPDVSRRHCRFVFADGRWHVFDLQSLNGIVVNGERVSQAALNHRDLVQIGSYTFEVDLQPGSPTVLLSSPAVPAEDRLWESISRVLPAPPEDPNRGRLAS